VVGVFLALEAQGRITPLQPLETGHLKVLERLGPAGRTG
jgi:hypothetical protein